MALNNSRLGLETNYWKTNQAEFFAFDKFALQNLANKSGRVSSHQRSKSTMRPCIYHTDLGENVVFHSFSRQTGQSIVGFWRNRSKNFQNHLRLAGSHF